MSYYYLKNLTVLNSDTVKIEIPRTARTNSELSKTFKKCEDLLENGYLETFPGGFRTSQIRKVILRFDLSDGAKLEEHIKPLSKLRKTVQELIIPGRTSVKVTSGDVFTSRKISDTELMVSGYNV